MAADTQFENPSLITVNEDLRAMTPKSMTRVDGSLQVGEAGS